MAYRTCAEAGSGRGIIDTTRRHQWLVPLKDFVARVHTGVEDARYLPIYLYAKEDKKEPTF